MQLSNRERRLAMLGLAMVCNVAGLILLSATFASNALERSAMIVGVFLAALSLGATVYVLLRAQSGLRWLLIPAGSPLAYLAIDALFRRLLHWP